MEGFQLEITGNWGHFKKSETNNNPLSHDLITKTALIGMIGAVLGIERCAMKDLYPVLSNDLLYGVRLLNSVEKISCGFSCKTAINPTGASSPKYFEFLRHPSFLVLLALKNENEISKKCYFDFQNFVKKGSAIYTPVLGLHNCPADLLFKSEGILSYSKVGVFETYGFVSTNHILKTNLCGYRIGFDMLPTYQNEDFWNLPDKFVNVIYPDYPNYITAEGVHYEYNCNKSIEQWYLI